MSEGLLYQLDLDFGRWRVWYDTEDREVYRWVLTAGKDFARRFNSCTVAIVCAQAMHGIQGFDKGPVALRKQWGSNRVWYDQHPAAMRRWIACINSEPANVGDRFETIFEAIKHAKLFAPPEESDA